MDRQITYKEDDLHSNLSYTADMLASIEFQIEMMEEQAIGLRENLDWKSVAANLRADLEHIKEQVNGFGIVELKCNQMLQVQNLCFNETHMDEIKERFSKIDTDIL